jgi:hypothetical protein
MVKFEWRFRFVPMRILNFCVSKKCNHTVAVIWYNWLNLTSKESTKGKDVTPCKPFRFDCLEDKPELMEGVLLATGYVKGLVTLNERLELVKVNE